MPVTDPTTLSILAVVFGAIFGILLHKGGVANYNVIVNQFRLRDFTVMKIMFTAIIIGGIGVLVLHNMGRATYDIKPANMLGVSLGAAIFGVGMVVYGYCPGTGIAAIATGSFHALVGFLGMLVGGALYALSFNWVEAHIQKVASLGKYRLPSVGLSDWAWFGILAGIAVIVFWIIEAKVKEQPSAR